MTKRVTKSKGSKNSSQKSDSASSVLKVIREGRTFLVTTHANPDGDALGSALALGLGLKKLGKRVAIYNQDSVPKNLRFLPRSDLVVSEINRRERFDASFLVDCAEKDRVGEVFAQADNTGKLVVIDHHRKSGREGDVNLIEPEAPSTGSVVLKILKRLRVPMTLEIATNIYVTLVTDTGNFRYSNTDASVFEIARELVEWGVRPWAVSKEIYESYPIERLRLLGAVLPTLEVRAGGKLASILLTQKMFQEAGATMDLAEDFINFPRSIEGVEVAVQFRETPEREWKVSLRSKDRVDVATLAARFGGGGHVRAAGCTLEGSRGEVQEKIYRVVEERFDNLKKGVLA